MGVVVDTNIFIRAERLGTSLQTLHSVLMKLEPSQESWISAITLAELVRGIYQAENSTQRTRRKDFIEQIAASFRLAAFDSDTAWLAGRIRGEQARIGNTLPAADSFIAATALQLDCSLLTGNTRDFVRIPGLRSLAGRL